MIELDDRDPRMVRALADLANRLGPYEGQPFDGQRVFEMCEIVKEHRIEFQRSYGYDFPPLIPFVLPSIKYVHFVRPDIDDIEIRIQLRNLIIQLARRHMLPAAVEIARAVRQCWPHYDPPIEEFRLDPLLKQELH